MASKAGGGGDLSALTEDELSAFEMAFYSDGVGDGQLTADKVRQIAEAVAPQQIAESTVQHIFQKCSGGQLFDFPKMLNMLADAIGVPSTEAQLQVSFEAFDKDRDGHVTLDEIKVILTKYPEYQMKDADIADIIKSCDTDGDGKLTFAEVIAGMKN